MHFQVGFFAVEKTILKIVYVSINSIDGEPLNIGGAHYLDVKQRDQ